MEMRRRHGEKKGSFLSGRSMKPSSSPRKPVFSSRGSGDTRQEVSQGKLACCGAVAKGRPPRRQGKT